MILKQTTGCVCNSLTVDGVEEIDLTEDQRKEVILKISEYIADQMKTDDLNCFFNISLISLVRNTVFQMNRVNVVVIWFMNQL